MLVESAHSWKTIFGRVILALGFVVFGALPAVPQAAGGSQEDLQFEILNATTGQPGTIERLVLQSSTVRLDPILDVQPTGSTFVIPNVPIREAGKYVLTVWRQGIPYYWDWRGRKLLEKPVLLHVFDTAQGLETVTISGLDLLIRKAGSLIELDYALQVHNSASPQVTLKGEPHVTVQLPADARTATLTYGNGPTPQELVFQDLAGGQATLAVPLTSGKNQMRLKTTLEWTENMAIPVGANVSVESWSLLVTPANLDIQAFDLVETDASGIGDNLQLTGPEVAANEVFTFRMASTQGPGTEEDLFTKTADETPESEGESSEKAQEEDNGFPFVVLTPIFVIVLVVVVRKRRRS